MGLRRSKSRPRCAPERPFPRAIGCTQQRAPSCRSLLHEPEVLLMVEPYGALDDLIREEMNAELHRIGRETCTKVMVTHLVGRARPTGQPGWS